MLSLSVWLQVDSFASWIRAQTSAVDPSDSHSYMYMFRLVSAHTQRAGLERGGPMLVRHVPGAVLAVHWSSRSTYRGNY